MLEGPLDGKEIKSVNPKGNQSWICTGRTDAEAEATTNTLVTWCIDLTHWKRPWCWETLKEGGEGDDRGWDGWMASSTEQTWVWASSGSWCKIEKTGVLQSMGSQKVRHNWVTEMNWKHSSSINRRQIQVILTSCSSFQKTDVSSLQRAREPVYLARTLF